MSRFFLCGAGVAECLIILGFLLALGLFGSDVRALVRVGKRAGFRACWAERPYKRQSYLFLSSLKKAIFAPVELCGMNLRRLLACRRISEALFHDRGLNCANNRRPHVPFSRVESYNNNKSFPDIMRLQI